MNNLHRDRERGADRLPPTRMQRVAAFAGELMGHRAGTAMVALAITLSTVAGFAGLGTEAAGWYFCKRDMQGAADAAAASAASALAAGALSSTLTTTAKSVTASFSFADGANGTTVSVNYPPRSGDYQSSPAVEVIISQHKQPLISRLFLPAGLTISARAVALANTSVAGQGCVVALDKGTLQGITATGSSTQLSLPGCSLYDNAAGSSAVTLTGGATISAADAFVVGAVSGGGLTTSRGSYTGADPLIDPYANAEVPSYGSSSCVKNYSLSGGRSDTKAPDTTGIMVFCGGIQLSGGSTLNLCPGTYILTGGSLSISGGSTLNAPPASGCGGSGGVTIILTYGTNGKCAIAAISGGANVSLTAPTAGALAGVALFQDRECTDSSQKNSVSGGASQTITGAIYFPGEAVTYSGGSSGGGAICTQLIADTITFSGTATFNNTCTGTGTRNISYTGGRLVE